MATSIVRAMAFAMMLEWLCMAVPVLGMDPSAYNGSKPHLIFILQDDLGYYDVAFNGNTNNSDVSANLTQLAVEGIVLERHYVHWHCSPTRRSFLSGRLPVHHHEELGNPTSDDLDLRYTWISEKLASAGYKNHFLGKADTGYKSMNHLPTRRGFDDFYGMLPGAAHYRAHSRWQNEHPVTQDSQFDHGVPKYCTRQGIKDCVYDYSTTAYGELALEVIDAHPPQVPLFLYLAWQAVHVPYEDVPDWSGDVYRGMLWKSDVYVGAIVNLLKQKGMYDNTLIVFSSDNGGVAKGNNYPLRGGKASNWEGGLRAASFVSGGIIPQSLRGSKNNINFHIVDWYGTFSFLAGVNGSDNPPVPPRPVDPQNPQFNIYGSESYPAADGVNIWPMLMQPDVHAADSAHTHLVLSKEVVIAGRYKLLVAQNVGWPHAKNSPWKNTAGDWTGDNGLNFSCASNDLSSDLSSLPGVPGKSPCLFDLDEDESERYDLTWQPSNATVAKLVHGLWSILNATILTSFCKNVTRDDDKVVGGGCRSSPKELLGDCNQECAFQYWKTKYGAAGKFPGPICGVPTCSPTPGPSPPSPPPPPSTNCLAALKTSCPLAKYTTYRDCLKCVRKAGDAVKICQHKERQLYCHTVGIEDELVV